MRPPQIRVPARNSERRLTIEERALWKGAVKAAKPLSSKRPMQATQSVSEAIQQRSKMEASAKEATQFRLYEVRSYSPPVQQQKHIASLEGLERSLRSDISKSRVAIDRRLDLHGLRQGEAHSRLKHFILDAYLNGDRTVIVITGKGGLEAQRDAATMSGGRGVLRRLTPQWLASSDLRDMIVGIDTAAHAHGGNGALYVRIRRRRTFL